MNKKDQELYNRIHNKYRTMRDDSSYDTYVSQREEAWDFYDGQQWTSTELNELKKRGQPPITVNQIATKVDALAGIEAQRRVNIKYSPRNFEEESVIKADVLTAYGYQIQEINDTSSQKEERFKDTAVGGLGWLRCTYDENRVMTEYVPAEEMLWDVTDPSPALTNQRMCARVKWVDIDRAKSEFPDKAKELQRLVDTDENSQAEMDTNDDTSDYVKTHLNQVKIVEVQYLKGTTAYSFKDAAGNMKEVFDQDYAEKNKAEGTEVAEIFRDRVYEGYFTDSILLDHSPLQVQIGKLEYLPLVWKRRRRDGAPYGVVASAIDLQREINKRRSKALHILNSKQIIAESGAIDNENIEGIRNELQKPNGVVLYKDGKKFQVEINQALANTQLDIMRGATFDLQATMGVSDELSGMQTNARSGVAIAQRQQASVSKQSFAFNRIRQSNKDLGRLMLAYMQGAVRDVVVQITGEDGAVADVIINQTQTIDGKEVLVRDVSTEQFDTVIDEAPEFVSSPQESATNLMTILNSPNVAQMALGNVDLLEALQIQNAKRIAATFTPNTQQGASPEEGAPTNQQPPSPAM